MADCIFCKIISGQIKSERVLEDDRAIAIRDINPKAPKHILVLPREHVPTIADMKPQHKELVGHLMAVANEIAQKEGIARSGYRLVINCGPDSGMEVSHLHLHVLGGGRLGRMG
ncbi:MAG: histidine triad nucleotide-binding protein [Chloroflexi bacterium]|nr:histidine triad nucleotide-binding protein [Chloroflexota bacterium]